MRATKWIMAVLTAGLVAGTAGTASADGWRHHGGYHSHNHGGHGAHKYVYDDGHCRHVIKRRGHRTKEVVRCRPHSYGHAGPAVWPGQRRYWVPPAAAIHTVQDNRPVQQGDTIVWNQPGAATPTQVQPEPGPDGRYCREYQGSATVGGEVRQVYGQACRQADGNWEIVQ